MISAPHNQILRELTKTDKSRVLERCGRQELPTGKLLVEVGARIDKVYFPERGVISAIAMFRDGGMIELAVVGREGCTGIVPMLGGHKALAGHLVQADGEALTLTIEDYLQLLQSAKSLKAAVVAYTRRVLHQMLVYGACNGLHRVEQRLARWLLLMHDRTDSDVMPLTQDFLATMLGVRRPSVTAAARELQLEGCISYTRGRLTIIDRVALERAACECYGIIRDGDSER